MKKLLASLFLLAAFAVNAQMPETTPLEKGDVEKFIKTYKPLSADLEALGSRFDNIQDYNMIQALSANKEVNDVLKKHGWDEQWLGKFMTISMSYMMVKMDEQLSEMSADEREQFEQYMGASFGPIKEMITEPDVQMVKERVTELDALFDNQ